MNYDFLYVIYISLLSYFSMSIFTYILFSSCNIDRYLRMNLNKYYFSPYLNWIPSLTFLNRVQIEEYEFLNSIRFSLGEKRVYEYLVDKINEILSKNENKNSAYIFNSMVISSFFVIVPKSLMNASRRRAKKHFEELGYKVEIPDYELEDPYDVIIKVEKLN